MPNDYVLFACKFLIPFVFAVVACVFDLKYLRIPNWISVSLFATGLVFGIVSGGFSGLIASVEGFAVGFGVLFILYAIGAGGAGDVKFMGGVGAWVGPYHVLMIFVMSAILLAVFATMVLAFRIVLEKGISDKGSSKTDRSSSADNVKEDNVKASPWKTRMPYAVPAATAILLRLVWMMLIHRTT